jgi:hypothetical protein
MLFSIWITEHTPSPSQEGSFGVDFRKQVAVVAENRLQVAESCRIKKSKGTRFSSCAFFMILLFLG